MTIPQPPNGRPAATPLPYPHPSDERVSARMRATPRRDTKPELRMRRELHARGMRFRVDFPIRTPRRLVRPDVVFTRARLAVFVDGCFWHCCPQHGTSPKANTDYWRPKLQRNVDRDRDVDAALRAAGWAVLRAWEHEDSADVAERVQREYQRLAIATTAARATKGYAAGRTAPPQRPSPKAKAGPSQDDPGLPHEPAEGPRLSPSTSPR